MTVTVPGRWQQQPLDPRGVSWVADDQALITLVGIGFSIKAPPPIEYLKVRGSPTKDSYLRIALETLQHPTGQLAAESVEFHGEDPRRPFRVLRVLRHAQALIILKLDADQWVSSRVGSEYAAAFASLGEL